MKKIFKSLAISGLLATQACNSPETPMEECVRNAEESLDLPTLRHDVRQAIIQEMCVPRSKYETRAIDNIYLDHDKDGLVGHTEAN